MLSVASCISTSLIRRHAAVLPVVVPLPDCEPRQGGHVRATQTSGFHFSQTQAASQAGDGEGGGGGHLVSSFMPDGVDAGLLPTQAPGLLADLDNDLMLGSQGPSAAIPQSAATPSYAPIRGGMSGGATTELVTASSVGGSYIRAVPGGSQDRSAYFAEQMLGLRERAAAVQLRKRNERQSRVQLFREYRRGEVPDIEIKLKDLLDPLQVTSPRWLRVLGFVSVWVGVSV